MKRAIASIALALLLSACGGGGGGSSQPSQQISPQVSVSISPSIQQNIDQGQFVSFTASVANDSSSQGVSWSLSGSGCSGSACGTLTNTTATAAKYNAPASVSGAVNVSVTARSVKDTSVSKSTAVAVAPAPAVTTTSLKGGTPGTAYSATLQATGGTGALSWSIASGTLPDGLALDASSGAISGTPTTGGTSTFTVQVTDSAATPQSQQKQLSITIVKQVMVITTASVLPDGTKGVAYSATLQANYAVLPVSWSITAGSLPNGLTLDQTTTSTTTAGLISGTPTATGTFNFTVTVTDSSSPAQSDSQPLSITINPGGAEDALLSGHYAFLLSGYDSGGNPVAVAGSFMADGSGDVQNGVEDINSFASGSAPGLAFSGTYAVGSDHRGTITLTNSQPNTFTMAIALGAVSSSSGVATKGSILEFDSSGYTMSGVIEMQDTSAFSQAALNGSYAFSFTGADSTVNRLGLVGEFTTDGSGGITGGLFDANDNGTITSSGTFTGAYTALDIISGRGQATLAGASPAPAGYAFYVVSAAKWLAISLDNAASSGLVTGEMDAQSGGPFTLSSLSGTSVVRLESSSSSPGAGSHLMLGLATFDGNGSASFSLDDNDAGTLTSLNPTGTDAVDSTGRFTLTQGTSEMVGYLIKANQGFILGTGTDVAAGVLEPQSSGPFSTSSLNATFFFGTEPFAAPPVPPPLGGPTASLSVGIITFDGIGNISGTKDSNQMGALEPAQTISDTYSVSPNGRVVAVGSNGSNSLILYIVSATKVVTMGTSAKDPNPTLGSAQQ
ncbi:MAG TPA: Ig domain-containing protein [Terriglobia bacterium]|nr:Ig domain-containing protein [Terriglobia bacterium]